MKGTENQIKWAEDIKQNAELNNKIEKILAAISGVPEDQKEAVREYWKNQDRAAKWIEANQYLNVHPESYVEINKSLAKKMIIYTLIEAGKAPKTMKKYL